MEKPIHGLISFVVLIAGLLLLVLLFMATASQNQVLAIDAAQLNNGRIIYLPFQNEIKNKSNTPEVVTVNGSVSYQRGALGNGVVLDKQASIQTSTNGLTNNFTVSLWLKPNYQGQATIFNLKSANQSFELIQTGEKRMDILVNGQNINMSNDVPTAWARYHSNGRLYNITLIYDKSKKQCTFYLDGVGLYKYGFSNFTCPDFNATGALFYLGKSSNPAFSGVIDEASVWNRVLTADEVKAYMSSTYDHYGDGVCEAGEDSLNSPVDCPADSSLTAKIRYAETSDFTAWYADPLVKPWLDRPVPTNTENGPSVKLAKNETRYVQVILTGKKDKSIDLSSISLETRNAPVTGKVSFLEYIPVMAGSDNFRQPRYPANTDARPDAAVPFSDYNATMGRSYINLKNGQHLPIIIEFTAPKQASAGSYNVVLRIESVTVSIPVQIYNFTLPDKPTIATLYQADGLSSPVINAKTGNVDLTSVAYLHGLTSNTGATKQSLIDTYLDAYADHKVGPYHAAENSSVLNSYFNFFDCVTNKLKPDVKSKLEERLTKYFDQKNIAATELSHLSSYWYYENRLKICGINIDNYDPANFSITDFSQYQTNAGYKERLKANFSDLADFLRNKGWLDRIYFVFDEPIDPGVCGGSYYLCVFRARAFSEVLTELGFKVGPVLPGPQWMDTVKGNGVVEKGNWFSYLATGDNGWQDEAYGGEAYTSAAGAEYWWYQTDHQAFDADSEAVHTNLMFWQMFQHDIKGSLQWAFIGWDNEVVNPWQYMRGSWGGNGNIVFFYPPCGNKSCSTPAFRVIPSIRLKQFRESIEDHAYLTLLKQRSPAQLAAIMTNDKWASLMNDNLTSSSRSVLLKNTRDLIASKLAGLPDPTQPPATPTLALSPTTALTYTPTPTQRPTNTPTPSISPTYTPSPTPTLIPGEPTPTITPTPQATSTPAPGQCDKTTDLNHDGQTDLNDATYIISALGQTDDNLPEDLNCDRSVDLTDFLLVVERLGT